MSSNLPSGQVDVKEIAATLSTKKPLHDSIVYAGVVDPMNTPKRPIAYCLLDPAQMIRPNRIASRPNAPPYGPCVLDHTQARSTNRECFPVWPPVVVAVAGIGVLRESIVDHDLPVNGSRSFRKCLRHPELREMKI